jgi:hypothetical protein
MKRMPALLLLAAGFALGTWIGWWMVPLVGLLWGAISALPGRTGARVRAPDLSPWAAAGLAALSAGLAWSGWLGYNGLAEGGLGRLAARLAAVMQVPLPLLLSGTILFPALLSAAAAIIGNDVVASVRFRLPRESDES